MFFLIISFLILIGLVIIKPGKFTEGGIALVGLFFLLMLNQITPNEIILSFLGNDLIQPFKIVLILITLSILSTTLDDYGFFKYTAYKAILLAKNNGHKLFRNFFLLTIIISVLISNDILILTITPIILWFARITKVKPIPYLFAVFVAANTGSIELLIGNLVNIVVAQVFHIGFVEFFLVMVLPKFVTLYGQYLLLKFVFRHQIPERILKPKDLAGVVRTLKKPLENRRQNLFVLTILILVVIGSIFSDFYPIQLWAITSLGAFIVLMSGEFNIMDRMKAVPWKVVGFVLVFIALTSKLLSLGVINMLAPYFQGAFSNYWSAAFFSSFFSAILSGIINNIPASISLSLFFQEITATAPLIIQRATAFGLVLGTNLGALLTPIGALASILWLTMIREKGYHLPIKDFLKLGFLFGVFSLTLTTLVVGIELFLFY